MTRTDGEWRRINCDSNQCVEILFDGDMVRMRSSRAPQDQVGFDSEEWSGFIAAVRRGEVEART